MSEPTDAMPSTIAIAGVRSTDQGIRSGSPFAFGSSVPNAQVVRSAATLNGQAETIGEGVWRETAAAAAYSSAMLTVFATMCWAWFPMGGIAIAMLGIGMALLGLSSRQIAMSTATLIFHVVALCGCYIGSL